MQLAWHLENVPTYRLGPAYAAFVCLPLCKCLRFWLCLCLNVSFCLYSLYLSLCL